MNNGFAILPVVLFPFAHSAFATQTPAVIEDEAFNDDEDPFAIGEIEIHHKKAVVVRTADLDEDGIVDVVIGGVDPDELPDGYSARVHYLDRWGVRESELLGDLNGNGVLDASEDDSADACYAIWIRDVDGDGHLDIFIGVNRLDEDNYVFLRRDVPVNGRYYNDPTRIKPVPRPDNVNNTGGGILFDADNDTDMDLVTAGNYGLRFYRSTSGAEMESSHWATSPDTHPTTPSGARSTFGESTWATSPAMDTTTSFALAVPSHLRSSRTLSSDRTRRTASNRDKHSPPLLPPRRSRPNSSTIQPYQARATAPEHRCFHSGRPS